MRKLFTPLAFAFVSSLLSLFLAYWPLAYGTALAWVLAAGTATTVVAAVRRRQRNQDGVEAALGLLAEYRVPGDDLPMPRFAKRLLTAYRDYALELSKRHAALSRRLDRYEFMALHTDELLTQVDGNGIAKYISPSVRQHLGYTPESLIDTAIGKLIHPDDVQNWRQLSAIAATSKQATLIEGRWLHADGHYVTLESSVRHAYGLQGGVVETISLTRNVEVRNALRDQLQRAARTDHLTGLPNRASLAESLSRFSAEAARKPFALFLFDLDRFKQVNDSLGHRAGDEYLCEIANRVRSVLRQGDVLARIGGDEFVALFSDVSDEATAQSIATRVVQAVCQPFICHGTLLHPKTSIGIYLCNEAALAADEMTSRADRALYAAKSNGGNHAVTYNDSHVDRLRKDFSVEQALRLALSEQRLVIQCQPIVDTATRNPVCAEALVRMRATDGSLIGPGYFIEVAERTGLIHELGQWVLEQACLHAMALRDAGAPTSISVNVSPQQLMHVSYLRSVEDVLARTGAPASLLVLEVTESAVIQDFQKAKVVLNHLRGLGFRLALDDFGTGYSSLSMLKGLPFDILKVDRAFVVDATELDNGPSTLAAILAIAASFQLTVVAEGIETDEQAACLEKLGCERMQGYRFHRPMDLPAHLELMCETHKKVRASLQLAPHLRLVA